MVHPLGESVDQRHDPIKLNGKCADLVEGGDLEILSELVIPGSF